jgi:hypothetical protein
VGQRPPLTPLFLRRDGAIILATVGQLVNSLRSINQWIVFGLIGLILVVVAIIVERKLDNIKAWQEVLDCWE